ncbi:MAG: nitroreductase family deazaflavin-dependent oxidoreductase [Byssovorax sp.]
MSEHFLYLETRGRTTGEPRTIEIWFVEHEGRFYMVSEHREASGWVKNLMKDASVRFSVGTREDRSAGRPLGRARARIVRPEEDAALVREVSARMDQKYGWSDGTVVEVSPA